jgi:uncharacterized protein DUF4129
MPLWTPIRIRAQGLRRIPICKAFLFLVCGLPLATSPAQNTATPGQVSPAPEHGIATLATELVRISKSLDKHASAQELAELGNSLPPEWTVVTPEGNFTISTRYLRGQLADGSKENAKTWADNLNNELGSYTLTPAPGDPNARDELNRILAGSQFAAVHPPTAWDLFRQRLAAWIERLLLRLFGGMASYPLGGQILFWIFVVLCVGFLALWVFRFVVGRDRFVALPPGRAATPARTWQEWVRAAREAANRGDFRKAVHSVYWAGITRMEDVGALPKDPAITPREYLRLVSDPPRDPGVTRVNYREPLSTLTVRLERIWYANRGAAPEDYLDALRQLEAMGCQLD